MKRGWIAAAAAISGMAASVNAEPPRYRVEELQALAPTAPGEFRGRGVTQFLPGGGALGYAASGGGYFSPVRWEGTTPIALDLPDGWASGYSFGQDAAGRIVGTVYDGLEYRESRAVVWEGGVPRILSDAGGPRASAFAVSAAGDIAGSMELKDGRQIAVVWRGGGPEYTELTPPAGLDNASAYAINHDGAMGGSAFLSGAWATTMRPVLWMDGVPVELPMPPAADRAGVAAMNDHGAVLGFWDSESTLGILHSALWMEGRLVDDPALATPNLQLIDLDNRGRAVGTLLGDEWSGVLYEEGELLSLTDLVEPGWVITQAETIADDGRIFAIGYHDGDWREVVLTPIPAPGPLVLLGLAAARRRR
ncbi:MAG: hypothetical protein IT436_06130 [Phycisphaerales bacterium]|nr:hypothetical protein [Phycisphaerales bacterium]